MKTATATTKNLDYYLSLPYTIVLKRDDEGDFVAKIEELDGCMSHGANEAEALGNLKEMQAVWLQDCLESGDAIPEPDQVVDVNEQPGEPPEETFQLQTANVGNRSVTADRGHRPFVEVAERLADVTSG